MNKKETIKRKAVASGEEILHNSGKKKIAITKLKNGDYQSAFKELGVVTHSNIEFLKNMIKQRDCEYFIREEKKDTEN